MSRALYTEEREKGKDCLRNSRSVLRNCNSGTYGSALSEVYKDIIAPDLYGVDFHPYLGIADQLTGSDVVLPAVPRANHHLSNEITFA